MITGIKKVKYAISSTDNDEIYRHIFMENVNGKTRFAAGTGGRFAVYDITDPDNKSKGGILIPGMYIKKVLRTLYANGVGYRRTRDRRTTLLKSFGAPSPPSS